MNNLKPCPFCGGDVGFWSVEFGVVRVVECEKCHVRFVFPFSEAQNSFELKEKWNERVKET